MFRMFFISFIVVFSLYQPLSKLDVVVLTTLSLDLIHASGMTVLLNKIMISYYLRSCRGELSGYVLSLTPRRKNNPKTILTKAQ